MTIEQTVEITSSRRVYFDVPARIPLGKTRITVKIDEPAGQGGRQATEIRHLCLNQPALKTPSHEPLEPLLGMAEGSAFTVERLLDERRREAGRE
jgi:hypothetical protein